MGAEIVTNGLPADSLKRPVRNHRTKSVESPFWAALADLEARLHRASVLTDDGLRREAISVLLRDPNTPCTNFLYNTLGVDGGAIGLAHASMSKFVLLQNSLMPLPEFPDLPIVDIPYWRKFPEGDLPPMSTHSAEHAVIHLMFARRRDDEALFKSVGHINSSDVPEFYKHLPPAGNDSWHLLSFEKKLRASYEGYGLLYCSAGEIAFFLYIWRWLFRLAQHFRLTHELDSHPPYNLQPSFERGRNFWNEETTFSAVGISRSTELLWLKQINGCYPQEPPTSASTSFLQQAYVEWQNIVDTIDAPSPCSEKENSNWGAGFDFTLDWQYLSLLKDDGTPTLTLRALLRYAQHVANNIGLPLSSIRTKLENLEHRYFGLSKPSRNRSTNTTLEPKSIRDIHALLWPIMFYSLLEGNGDNDSHATRSLIFLLNSAHEKARFPLLPYFYMTALKRSIREHLVVPLWQSPKFPMKISRSEEEEQTESPNVVLGLLTLKAPWDTLRRAPLTKDRVPEQRDSEISRETLDRLRQISTLFRQLVRPIVDEGFYGGLVQNQITQYAHSRRSAEDWRSFTAGVSHGFKRETEPYRYVLERALMLLPESETELRQQIEWIYASTTERGMFFDFLQNLALYLSGADKSFQGNRIFAQQSDFESWVSRLIHDVRLPEILHCKASRKPILLPGWESDAVLPEPVLRAPVRVGSETAFRYIVFELVKNALSICSGRHKLVIDLAPEDLGFRLRLWNDLALQIRSSCGSCPTCGARGELVRIASYEGPLEGECAFCLAARVRDVLKMMFTPGQSRTQGGSGLGLFLIQFLLERVMHGTIEACLTNSELVRVPVTSPWTRETGVCLTISATTTRDSQD